MQPLLEHLRCHDTPDINLTFEVDGQTEMISMGSLHGLFEMLLLSLEL